MGDHSGIQWTDATWNPTTGCTRVSAGCDNCYAFQLHDQRHLAHTEGRFPNAPAQYHKPFSEVQLIPERLALPLRWTKPRRIFVDSMADLFHAKVPDTYIASVFAVMAAAQRHTFQVLTKRPQRMQKLLGGPEFEYLLYAAAENLAGDLGWCDLNLPNPWRWPLPNVWLGTSVENQEAAYRIDWLVKTPAAVRFLSCEPLLGSINLEPWLWEEAGPEWAGKNPSPNLGWVIVGGESGPGYRPVDLDWVRDLRDQCQAASTPFFFKQVGGRTAKAGGRELDGREWNEMPLVAA